MKTRAAVAFAAKKPLEIVEVDLEGPKAGEVLVEIKATGICHTDAYTLDGLDSARACSPRSSATKARAWCSRSARRDQPEAGRPRDPALHARMPAVQKLPVRKTNLCTAIRATQGKGLMPDGTSRFSYKGQTDPPLHGLLDLLELHTVLPEIAVAKIRKDAPFDKACYIGCGVTTGVGAVVNTAKVEPGANAIVFGLGGIGLNVIQGLKMVGADMIVGVDINGSEAWGRQFGMTHFVNPKTIEGDLVAHLVALTDGGADYTFDCTGNTTSCARRWRPAIAAGARASSSAWPRPARRSPPGPFQLVTGRVWKGSAFGGARGRTDVPKIVDWYMDGKIQIDPMITHVLPLERINEAFDLMHGARASARWWCSRGRKSASRCGGWVYRCSWSWNMRVNRSALRRAARAASPALAQWPKAGRRSVGRLELQLPQQRPQGFADVNRSDAFADRVGAKKRTCSGPWWRR
jgi:S-(hydroxymethyl)glutathione dehydrogenase/alcohol dehydrogenase